MKKLALIFILLLGNNVMAHDEGHGPKITDAGKKGGVVSPVIEAGEALKGTKAILLYKAELIRSEDGTVRVYYYDKDMNSLDLSKLDKSAKGYLEFKKNKKDKKWTKQEFTLNLEEGAFMGKAPKSPSKPFNIDVVVKEGGKELFSAFDNLD